jgi:DNA-binding winged helix-turn-helix (wHTH) protein
MITSTWRFGSFELDVVERRLLRDGKVVAVPPKAFDVLTLLVRNSGRLVKRQQLFDEVWPGVEVEDANLTNNVTALRKVLGSNCIASVPKHGYRFCLPVSTSSGLSQEISVLVAEAQDLLSKRTADNVLRSRDLLWLVIAHEPRCALAWAWLGRAARFLDKNGVDRPYHGRLTDIENRRALGAARGALNELQTQAELASSLGFITQGFAEPLLDLSIEVAKLINGLLGVLEKEPLTR